MNTGTFSLRTRILGVVLALIALASLLQATTAYRTALAAADTLFDQHLQEMVAAGTVTYDDAISAASNPQDLTVALRAAGVIR